MEENSGRDVNCKNCIARCSNKGNDHKLHGCIGYEEHVNITNADRIRNMSDEELAEWLSNNDSNFPIGDSRNKWFDWLREEVKDD